METTIEKIKRLEKEFKSLPMGNLHIKRKHKVNYYSFEQYISPCDRRGVGSQPELLYALGRKKYLELYIRKLKAGPYEAENIENEILRMKVAYKRAGVEWMRIIVTPWQYQWAMDNSRANPTRPEDLRWLTQRGVPMRSKSERAWADLCDERDVPYQYDSLIDIDVVDYVNKLTQETGFFRQGQPLFEFSNGLCRWNVPTEYQWMNISSSPWLRYNVSEGTVPIYVDFLYPTGRHEIVGHEHLGLLEQIAYRTAARDRLFLLREIGGFRVDNFFTTTEADMSDLKKMGDFIDQYIVPLVH